MLRYALIALGVFLVCIYLLSGSSSESPSPSRSGTYRPPPSSYRPPTDDMYAPPELLADDEPEIVAGGSLQSRRNRGDGNVRVTYRWEDPHTLRIVRWSGDKAMIDPRSKREELVLTTEIDRDHMRQVMASFGFPDSWAVLAACSKAELEKKRRAFLQMAAARGFACEADRLRVDHKWVVEKSKEDMDALASALQRSTKSRGYRTQRELLGIMASFVQSMAYRIPPRVRRTRSGKSVKTGGITMPIETLYNGYGDCDTKSLLFASILANFPHQRLIFLMGNRHLFVGVRVTPRLNDHYVEIRGTRYVLIEMTQPWPVGRIPQKAWLDSRRNVFKTVEIVDTTSR